jgi:predicted HD phosphohydrolase
MTTSDRVATPLLQPVPLAHTDWQYVRKRSLEEYRTADWQIQTRQRAQYFAENTTKQILRLLACQKDDSGYAYTVNNYYHCLQTATRMLRAGLSDEDVVVGLLHDIGFVSCHETHGEFAAVLLRPFVSERNYWMLVRHAVFQKFHCHELVGCDRHERDRWRGHPHFAWTAEFVEKFDQSTISYDEEALTLEAFEPLVGRVIAQRCHVVAYD